MVSFGRGFHCVCVIYTGCVLGFVYGCGCWGCLIWFAFGFALPGSLVVSAVGLELGLSVALYIIYSLFLFLCYYFDLTWVGFGWGFFGCFG